MAFFPDSSRRHKLLTLALAASLFLLVTAVLQAVGGGIVKWVDEKGVTHYGDHLPPGNADKSSVVLDNKGVVIKKNDATLPLAERERLKQEREKDEKLKAEQDRRDRILLASYSSEQEIDAARDRKVQLEQSTIQTLEVSLGESQKKLGSNKKLVADLQARKKPVPADLTQDIASLQRAVSRDQEQIAMRRKEIDNINQHFSEEKRRYAELKNSSLSKPNDATKPETPAPR